MVQDVTIDTPVEYGLYALAIRCPELFEEAERFTGGMLASDQDAVRRVKALTRPGCPDGGTCHHDCGASCWRVNACVPLTGSGWEDWPQAVKAANPPQI